MADPLSISASIVAVLQLTTTVVQYINDVKDAPRDRLSLRDEISSTSWTLYMLKDRLDQGASDPKWLSSVVSIGVPNGPIDQFKRLLEQLAAKLVPGEGGKKGLHEFGKTLVWPFKKEEIKQLLNAVERQKSLFHLALQNDILTLAQAIKLDTSGISALSEDVAEIVERVEQLQTSETSSERRAIIKWLSPLNFYPTQDDYFRRREEGTGQWLLESAQFKTWLEGSGDTLWCPGIPGAGKTIITSIVVDHIRTIYRDQIDNDIGVACVYCNYKEQNVQTLQNLIASIWMQLVQGKDVISDSVKKLYRSHVDKNTSITQREVLEVLESEIRGYKKTYIIIDALDECTDDYTREALVKQVRRLQPTANLMVTSRFLDRIARIFTGTPTLEIKADPEDVRAYVAGRISRGGQLSRHADLDMALAEDIKESVTSNAQDMFLLAQLHMDSLISKGSRKAIRQTLKSLPKNLDATYEEAMTRIEEQSEDEKELAEKVLFWISFAMRPLTSEELREALAVELDSHEVDDENRPDEDLLTSVCAGLVVEDHNSGVIRLVHYSTQEYFKRIRSTIFPTAPKDIAMTCLTYLLFDDFKDGPLSLEEEVLSRIGSHSLIQYAAINWGWHAQGQWEDDAVLGLMLRFLTSEKSLASSIQIAHFTNHWWRGESQKYPRDVIGLHIAAHFGLYNVAKILISRGYNVASVDSNGETPLHKAAKDGHDDVVRLLLQNGANIMSEDKDGWTALHNAATGGNRELVLLLLENGATISKGVDGRTALHFAAQFGKEEIADVLLGQGADVKAESIPYGSEENRKFLSGRTPLHWAAANGYNGLVKLLIDHGADVNALNTTFRSPLQEAVMWRHVAAVKTLLENGASVNVKDNEGWTPLHEAAWRSPGIVAEMLLEHDADIDAVNRTPQGNNPGPLGFDEIMTGHNTPIQLAASCDNLEVFNVLHKHGASLTKRGANGFLSIHIAAMTGSTSTLKAIVEAGFDVDARDTMGDETALHKAARRGHEDCVQLLLDHGADAKAKNNSGEDARDMAVAGKWDGVLQILPS